MKSHDNGLFTAFMLLIAIAIVVLSMALFSLLFSGGSMATIKLLGVACVTLIVLYIVGALVRGGKGIVGPTEESTIASNQPSESSDSEDRPTNVGIGTERDPPEKREATAGD